MKTTINLIKKTIQVLRNDETWFFMLLLLSQTFDQYFYLKIKNFKIKLIKKY